mmetsp:Transcript_12866/g.51349  ORF Transcript_12866/g.51349 Transcript_12866/m.51349 type:complete len:257 (+) Transcript_12866:2089-2859(+)
MVTVTAVPHSIVTLLHLPLGVPLYLCAVTVHTHATLYVCNTVTLHSTLRYSPLHYLPLLLQSQRQSLRQGLDVHLLCLLTPCGGVLPEEGHEVKGRRPWPREPQAHLSIECESDVRSRGVVVHTVDGKPMALVAAHRENGRRLPSLLRRYCPSAHGERVLKPRVCSDGAMATTRRRGGGGSGGGGGLGPRGAAVDTGGGARALAVVRRELPHENSTIESAREEAESVLARVRCVDRDGGHPRGVALATRQELLLGI